METAGTAFMSARKQRQLSLADVERATGIRQKYLRALESGDYLALPGGAYTRGFLHDYAAYLELDPAPFLAAFQQQSVEPARSVPVRPPTRLLRPGFVLPLGYIMAVIGVASLALFGFYLYREYAPILAPAADDVPTPVPGVPGATVTAFAPVVMPPAPTPTPTPRPTPTVPVYPGVEVEVSVKALCWVKVTIDDGPPTDFPQAGDFLQPGAVRTWVGRSKVCVLMGNAGAAYVRVNGEWTPEPGKPQGMPGEVLEKCWTKGQQ